MVPVFAVNLITGMVSKVSLFSASSIVSTINVHEMSCWVSYKANAHFLADSNTGSYLVSGAQCFQNSIPSSSIAFKSVLFSNSSRLSSIWTLKFYVI